MCDLAKIWFLLCKQGCLASLWAFEADREAAEGLAAAAPAAAVAILIVGGGGGAARVEGVLGEHRAGGPRLQ